VAGLILAIETSCDDTCAAVLDGPRILSNVISSQAEAHARFGGVVPEVASGLIGALLVGVSTAKAIAASRRLPLIPVDHLQGHVAANFLEPDPLEPPFLCLVASGGHTMLAAARDQAGHEVLGRTLDDAAGEAFDKVARMLGLGYPGGPALERLAEEGDPDAFELPVAMSRDPGLDFSFSGLKTALVYLCRDLGPDGVQERRADLAAGFQAAAVGQLTAKLGRALRKGGWDAVALGGGVAANGPLRQSVSALCEQHGVELKLVPIELCTDNAAMIGSAARFAPRIPYPGYLSYDAFPSKAAA
jgi:N6-L-threonylcarbamoyladenine synthase